MQLFSRATACEWHGNVCRRRHDLGKGFKPLMIYDTAEKKLSPHQSTYWADFYQENRRDPTNIEPAPWVKARLGDLAWK